MSRWCRDKKWENIFECANGECSVVSSDTVRNVHKDEINVVTHPLISFEQRRRDKARQQKK